MNGNRQKTIGQEVQHHSHIHKDHIEKRKIETNVEIIDFYRPTGNRKNLFVSNIYIEEEEDDSLRIIQTAIHKAFSSFGLIFEIQVFSTPSCKRLFSDNVKESADTSNHQSEKVSVSNTSAKMTRSSSVGNLMLARQENIPLQGFYAFVKFYSMMSAKRAKSHLNMTSLIGVKPLKVKFASRKKTEKQDKLYLSNCYDLVNFYLGFNGWTSRILVLKRDEAHLPTSESEHKRESSCRFLCIIELNISHQGLVTQGVSTVEETWDTADRSSKSSALARCRKRSHQYALENAFSKLILVVLENGKVYAEIDTTQADLLHRLESLQNLNLVTVHELEEELEESSEEEEEDKIMQQGVSTNIDHDNVNILMELEAEACD